MKCYYEVLDIPRDADDGEIKSAYRKMALKWHPDKNLDNAEDAKEQFQMVQQAYEVLSDKQERAWYDNHREQILRGANSEFQDNCLDVFQYFTTACFQGYNDEEKGFYTVYRKVFEQIAKEDMEFMEDKDEFCDIPQFGTSTSDFDSIVKPFYDYWMSYSTKKSYSWLDPIDIREGKGNRRVMKYIEKENKKVRSKAKAERNEEIRNLVAFVRKRDKRVQAYKKQLEEKTAENRKKQEELSKQRRQERQKLHETEVQAEWAKFDNVQSELEEIEKHLAAQFGEEISNSEEEEEDFNNLYCIACNKVFKNPKAFENHESSKKHRENVEKLKEVMQEEEKSSNFSDDLQEFDECEDINEDLDNIVEENCVNSGSESLGSDDSQEEVEITKSKQKKKNKRKNKSILSPSSEVHSDDYELTENLDEKSSEIENLDTETSSTSKNNKKKVNKSKNVLEDIESNPGIDLKVSDDDFDFGMSKKQKKKNRKSNVNNTKKEENVSNSNEATEDTSKVDAIKNEIDKSSKPRAAKKVSKTVKKEVTAEDLEEIDISHCCVTCKADFPSKNKLFDHLKKTGHGVYLPPQKSRGKKRTDKSIKE